MHVCYTCVNDYSHGSKGNGAKKKLLNSVFCRNGGSGLIFWRNFDNVPNRIVGATHPFPGIIGIYPNLLSWYSPYMENIMRGDWVSCGQQTNWWTKVQDTWWQRKERVDPVPTCLGGWGVSTRNTTPANSGGGAAKWGEGPTRWEGGLWNTGGSSWILAIL